MAASILIMLAAAATDPDLAERVMACYLQEDNLSQRDAANPNQAHPEGPKYLIAWKFSPRTSFGITKAQMEIYDPHGFLKGNAFTEQNFNPQGTGFFAGEPSRETFAIVVMPDQTSNGLQKAQFILTREKKVAGMAFGFCKSDERDAAEAFAFWKTQRETLP